MKQADIVQIDYENQKNPIGQNFVRTYDGNSSNATTSGSIAVWVIIAIILFACIMGDVLAVFWFFRYVGRDWDTIASWKTLGVRKDQPYDVNIALNGTCDELGRFTYINSYRNATISRSNGLRPYVTDRFGPNLIAYNPRDDGGIRSPGTNGWGIETFNNGTGYMGFYQSPTGRVGICTKKPEFKLHVNGSAYIDGTLNVTGDMVIGNNLTVMDLNVLGSSCFLDNVTIKENLTVNKNLGVLGDTHLHGDMFINKTLTVNNDLHVVGNTYLHGDVSVNQTLTVQNNIDILNGNVTIGGCNVLSQSTHVLQSPLPPISFGKVLEVGSFDHGVTRIKAKTIVSVFIEDLASTPLFLQPSLAMAITPIGTFLSSFTSITGTYVPSSRLIKRNITEIDPVSASRKIMALKPSEYKYSNEWIRSTGASTDTQCGFIAEQVRDEVDSSIVHEKEMYIDNAKMTIPTIKKEKFIPLLVSHIQTLTKKIELLETRLSAIESK